MPSTRFPAPSTDFGEPFPDQKKYCGLGLGPGGMFLNASAISGCSGRKLDCRQRFQKRWDFL